MTILAFGASNSHNSINKALVTYAAALINSDVEVIDLNDYEMPLYSQDREKESGIPAQAHQFYDKIGRADALLISFAEHNGNVTAAYKNLFDWTSRIDQKVYQGKTAVLLSASPGPGGGRNSLAVANGAAPHVGLEVKETLSVPRFYDNFDMQSGRITNSDIQAQLETALSALN